MTKLLDYLETFAPDTDLPLDPGIRYAVLVLRAGGVETFESCQGGAGHAHPEPFVKFHGSPWAGYHAFSVAMEYGLPALTLQRVYDVNGDQLEGPYWMLIFRPRVRNFPCPGEEKSVEAR